MLLLLKPYNTQYPSFFCISSVHPNTSIKFKTYSGQVHYDSLQQYESLRFDSSEMEDLSGTVIESDKAIAVMSGIFTWVPNGVGGADGLLSHLAPLKSWGERFAITPLMNINSGYILRLFTSDVATTVSMSDNTTAQIPAQTFYEKDVQGHRAILITSDHPVMVVQYLKGYYANRPSANGDPSMLIVPPIKNFGSTVAFTAFQYGHSRGHLYHITVVALCRDIDELLLDGMNITRNTWNYIDQTMCYVEQEISTGNHIISHTNPLTVFFVYVYAFGVKHDSSYLYSASAYYSPGWLFHKSSDF